MHCPACKTSALATQPLDENLLTLRCPQCEGHWLKSFQYWKWRESQPQAAGIDTPHDTEGVPESDSRAGKLCPECGRFLMHRPVGHGVAFNLDRCGHCGGMWFDKCEWDTLQSNSLHRNAHFIFTEAWQTEVAESNRIEAERVRLKKLLRGQDYRELMRVAQWIRGHRHCAALLAILNNADQKLINEA